MKDAIRYIKQAHSLLFKEKKLFIVGFVISLLYALVTAVTTITDPYGLISTLSILIIFLIGGYFFLLPLFVYKAKTGEQIGLKQISNVMLDNKKRVITLFSSVMAVFILLMIVIAVLDELFWHTDLNNTIFMDTLKNHGFGFYPGIAFFGLFTELVLAPLWLLPITYFLEKNKLVPAFKRAFGLFFKHVGFFVPIVLVSAIYHFIIALYVPTGNYFFMFFQALTSTYIDALIVLASYLLYKNHHTINISSTKTIAAKKDEVKHPNKVEGWSRFAALVVLAEANVFMGYAVLSSYLTANNFDTANFSSYFYVALAAAAPFIVYLLRNRKLNINLLSIKFACVALLAVFAAAAVVPSQPVSTPEVVKQTFTGDELLAAVNKKRVENGTPLLKKNEWACVVANFEVEEDIKLGNGQFTSQDSYTNSIEKMKEKYRTTTAPSDSLPNILTEYMSYGYGLNSTIADWENSTSKLIFLDKTYTVGCAVVKDGYSVVVTAEEFPEETQIIPEDQVDPYYSG